MSEVRLFGESIGKDVIEEIELREKIIAGTQFEEDSVLKNNTRSVQDLQHFSGRTAWIRMISSVDVFNNEGTPTPAQAKNFILSGGELQVEDNTVKRKSGVSFQAQDRSSVYRKSDNLGVRPEAGITSFDIKHKGTYGSLREANISFNVWTREDLDRAQNIYLRPGVHMIVEWGHTVYRDSTNGNNKQPSFPDSDKYFTVSTRNKIQEIIQEFRQKNSLNYDGFIGLVSNFSWSFRPDGGYDCTVRIVSAGSLLESIGMETGKDGITEAPTESASDILKEVDRSVFHLISAVFSQLKNEIAEAQEDELGPFQQIWRASRREGWFSFSGPVVYEPENIPNSDSVPSIPVIGTGLIKLSDTDVLNVRKTYIPLGEIVFLINKHFLTSIEDPIFPSILLNPEQRFKTFPQHFSINPAVCILPNDAQELGPGIQDIPSGIVSQVRKNSNPDDEKKPVLLSGGEVSSLTEDKTIANIWVNVDLIRNRIDNVLSKGNSDLSENSAFDIITDVLEDINSALGSITQLGLHYNEDENNYVIVDRNHPNVTQNNVKALNITGLRNTVKDISIETKITPNLASMIAISAQGSESVTGNSLTSNIGMVQWNSNIRDRFTQRSTVSEREREEEEFSRLSEREQALILERNIAERQLKIRTDRLKDIRENPDPRFAGTDAEAESIANLESDITRAQTRLTRANQKLREIGFKGTLDKVVEPYQQAYEKLFGLEEDRTVLWELLSFKSVPEFTQDVFQNHRRYAVKYFREKYFESLPKITEGSVQETSDPGLIPVQLSITMDGIAGFVIGQVFKIKDIENVLPENYKNYGFILTGVDHAIVGERWETTLRALTFKLP